MFDAMHVINTIKNVPPEVVGGTTAIAWLFGECGAVASQDGMDLARKGFNRRKNAAPLRFVALSKNAT